MKTLQDAFLVSIANRPKVLVFLDISGSMRCMSKIVGFLKECQNRNNCQFFMFDSEVRQFTTGLFLPRGTNYQVIEDFVQSSCDCNNQEHPTVIVITDGIGMPIQPKQPEKWVWLLVCPCPDGRFPVPDHSEAWRFDENLLEVREKF